MKTARRTAAVTLLLLAGWAAPAAAADYYVDSANGAANDAGPGTESEPWAHCPGMTGWTGSASLQPGDVVYFHSAGQWEDGSGEAVLQAAAGVTYDGASWGSGDRAILRATGDLHRSVISFMADHPTEATVVRGFEADAAGHVTTGVGVNWPQADGDLTGATKRIENCVVHDTYSESGQGDYEYGIVISSGYGGQLHVSNVEVLDSTIFNTSRGGINLYSANDDPQSHLSNLLIRGNEVYASGMDPDYAGSALAIKNHIQDAVVEFNYVHDSVRGGGIGISSHEVGFRGPENAIVRHNIVAGHAFVGVNLLVRGDTSVDLYGNIIMGNTYQGVRLMGAQGQLEWRIFNNTLLHNTEPDWSHEILIGGNDATIVALEVSNNLIVADAVTMPLYDESGDITTHESNLYYRPGDATLARVESTSYSPTDITTWEPTALTGEPGFMDLDNLPWGFIGTFGVDLQPNTDGLNLAEGSPALDQGAALGASYEDSINSVARPNGDGWDVGAYEFSPDAGAPPDAGSPPDAGDLPDAGGGGTDPGPGAYRTEDDGGCGCRLAGLAGGSSAGLLLLVLVGASRVARRRRR
ncbi:MAG: right-handed parallel beta-helix repeat-containing protein [Deltaproteobacteria bacterium]|nr:right-handed parallel beta-helix repeat-containing protein [Deltaproteobacteria bacterium]